MSNDGFEINPDAEGTTTVEIVPDYDLIRAQNRDFLIRLIVCLEENPDLARRLRVALANAGSIGVPA